MSSPQKRKCSKRNFDQEAELQIKILEQKAREDFLTNFLQYEDSTPKLIEPNKDRYHSGATTDTETKIYIPTKAKSILEKWMYEHRLYCYPTKAEKQALALETGLSVQKISNWFINSRRRMLPKMLETEGRDPINFTISRKKKKNTIVASTTNNPNRTSQTNSLTDYAIQEESKVIDQNCILFGNESEINDLRSNYESVVQEIDIPYTDNEDESKSSYHTVNEQPHQSIGRQIDPSNHITRGILYDQATQSKCLFIIVSSSK